MKTAVKIRVYYEDTDSLGMVYHANYLKFIERARSEAFFAIGDLPEGGGSCFVVRSMKLRFIKSAKLGDLLRVKSEIVDFRFASFRLAQEIFFDGELEGGNGAPIFVAEVELAHLSGQKPAAITPDLKHRILSAFETSR